LQPGHHQSRQENEEATSAGAPRLGVPRGPKVHQCDVSKNPLRIDPAGQPQKDGDEQRDQNLGNEVAGACRWIERPERRMTLYSRKKGTARIQPSRFDRLLRPIHAWVWSDPRRRARKLLRFAETEASGGQDLSRAAELTTDGLLRRLFLRHALDEHRHADLFRERGRALMRSFPDAAETSFDADWFAPGERGLDDIQVDGENDSSLLAFLHLTEKAAASRFALYGEVLAADPETQGLFNTILRDEAFHMTYTHQQLTRVAPRKWSAVLWKARLGRLWKAYLRIAAAVVGLLGTMILLLQYALFLPPFALLAKRYARREPQGWFQARSSTPLRSQY